MEQYVKLSEISRRASLSVRTIKKHLHEIPHYRPTKGPILMRWSDFQTWMERSRRDALNDPYVRQIIEHMAAAGVV